MAQTELTCRGLMALAAPGVAVFGRAAVHAPTWQLAFLNGTGKRVGESGLGLIKGHAYSAPYEDVTIKNG